MSHSKIVHLIMAQSDALKKSVMLLRMARVIRIQTLHGIYCNSYTETAWQGMG